MTGPALVTSVAPGPARAIWVSGDTLAIPEAMVPLEAHCRFAFHPELALLPAGYPTAEHLQAVGRLKKGRWQVFRVRAAAFSPGQPLDTADLLRECLRHDPVLQIFCGNTLCHATGTHIAKALDALYPGAATCPIGTIWEEGRPTLHLWAPTALSVDLLLWPTDEGGAALCAPQIIPAEFDPASGNWRCVGAPEWKDRQYVWRLHRDRSEATADLSVIRHRESVEVTDPASVALTANGTRSVLVDPADPQYFPLGWHSDAGPAVPHPARQVIWEVHVRDFSARDAAVPAEHRGRYLAFTHRDSAGMRHLRGLAQAGLTTVELLPTYDFATVPENEEDQVHPDLPAGPLSSPAADPASPLPQELISATADRDAYNWGYDPVHWAAPEGSYVTREARGGGGRLLQFRQMVAALHREGLRVVIDGVFTHMAASGRRPFSVLDQIVPGYYHRRNDVGVIEGSACNDDTAPENLMVGRLIEFSVLHWVVHHHCDGIRFDLMGHMPIALVRRIRASLDALNLSDHGVDGRAVTLHGEGWDFGPIAGDALFPQATQRHCVGGHIAAFDDRVRDALRGGSPFDSDHRAWQGWATGLCGRPNGVDPLAIPLCDEGGAPSDTDLTREQRHHLWLQASAIRSSLAGGLAAMSLPDATGFGEIRAGDIPWGNTPLAWGTEVGDSLAYVDAHDNETLFDILAWKLPATTPMEERIRYALMSLAVVTLGQGPCLWHAGTEILRSKSLDRDSFDSGDYFNAVDWTAQDSTFGVGLPRHSHNGWRWDLMRPLLSNPELRPTSADMHSMRESCLDLLRLRASTGLFWLGSAHLIRQKVSFPTYQGPPGCILLRIEDSSAHSSPDCDPALDTLLLAFNPWPTPVTLQVPSLDTKNFILHPIQASGADPALRAATFTPTGAALTLPATSATVFIEPTHTT
ncbi:MAG: pullulanase-type alpha-1,6-glucosidase [Actinomycetaceae bacterium]|nr:pullulanase-type alpha-1,6-glucosidase [Actinomycetaceae bacterium]